MIICWTCSEGQPVPSPDSLLSPGDVFHLVLDVMSLGDVSSLVSTCHVTRDVTLYEPSAGLSDEDFSPSAEEAATTVSLIILWFVFHWELLLRNTRHVRPAGRRRTELRARLWMSEFSEMVEKDENRIKSLVTFHFSSLWLYSTWQVFPHRDCTRNSSNCLLSWFKEIRISGDYIKSMWVTHRWLWFLFPYRKRQLASICRWRRTEIKT